MAATVVLWARRIRRSREEEALRLKLKLDEETRQLEDRTAELKEIEGILDSRNRFIDLLKSRSL